MWKAGTFGLVFLGMLAYTWAELSACTYNRARLSVSCTDGSRSKTCGTISSGGSGPPPAGEYRIGQRYTHSRHHLDWYNLYPRSTDGRTYYDYYMENPETGRSHIAFHPGAASAGCVTVGSRSCWNDLRDIVDAGSAYSFTIKRSFWRSGRVNFIGTMRVI